MRSLRLTTRLALTHGALVAFLLFLLLGTQQRLLRIVELVAEISDQRLSTIDAEEALHRSAWDIEVAVRQAHRACEEPNGEDAVRKKLIQDRSELVTHLSVHTSAPPRLRGAVVGYMRLADDALAGETCAFVANRENDARRLALDEELTNAWIDRLHTLHSDIEAKENEARRVGVMTAIFGVSGAAIAAFVAVVVARNTARSVTEPVARLAQCATRVGEGDFGAIPEETGSREIEELWRDLERMRSKLLASEQQKQIFLASVSHELRTPLARLREALALLTDGSLGALSERQARVAQLATRACEQEVHIVSELLDMSRLRSGQPIHRTNAASIDRIVHAAVETETAAATDRGVTIEVIADGVSPRFDVDPVLLERALANLVRNAVSVSKRGQKVRLRRVDEGAVVRLLVEDEGPGLPDAMRENIFQPFNTAAITSVDRPSGIGLGLSLAREVARAHDGELELVRSDERGTTFAMTLPLKAEKNRTDRSAA